MLHKTVTTVITLTLLPLISGLIHNFNYMIYSIAWKFHYLMALSSVWAVSILLYYRYYNGYSFTFLFMPLLCNCPHKSCQTSYKVKSPEKRHSSYQQNDVSTNKMIGNEITNQLSTLTIIIYLPILAYTFK